MQDSYGDTVLHDAIAKDFIEIVEVLVNFRGVDLAIKNKRGFNCLHHAALKGNARLVVIFEREKGKVGQRGGGGGGRKGGGNGESITCLFPFLFCLFIMIMIIIIIIIIIVIIINLFY